MNKYIILRRKKIKYIFLEVEKYSIAGIIFEFDCVESRGFMGVYGLIWACTALGGFARVWDDLCEVG